MLKVEQLLHLSSTQTFEKGAVIVRDGDTSSNHMFLLLKGEVGVYKNYRGSAELKLAHMGPGEFFGEMTLFLGRPRSATVVALSDVTALSITRENAYLFFSEQPEATFAILRMLCERLEKLNHNYEDIYQERWTEMSVLDILDSHFDLDAEIVTTPLPEPPAPVQAAPPSAPAQAPAPAQTPAPQAAQTQTPKTSAPSGTVIRPYQAPKSGPVVAASLQIRTPVTRKPVADEAPCEADPAAAAAAPAAEKALADSPAVLAPSGPASIFPEGHGSYTLPLKHVGNTYIFARNYTCPLCGKPFMENAVRASKLRTVRTDSDMRTRYADIEPMYYEIITCPHCYYSAFDDMFKTAMRTRTGEVNERLSGPRTEFAVKTGDEKDTFSVFAGYYLALLCTPFCFTKYRLTTARLWLRLSRLYSDLEDTGMWRFACEKARQDYLHGYQNYHVTLQQSQQISFFLGDLAAKLGDNKEAKRFFFKAKTEQGGSEGIKNYADDRIAEIRALERAEGV
ncbi:DUF2225 domain-containing protein [Oscillospiraceae bacterium OttesenSCG-928-F05]|nr:DUF2225 domain-containing protein [Oscillospiraceae bacterium OttesenSCG-928-F05]